MTARVQAPEDAGIVLRLRALARRSGGSLFALALVLSSLFVFTLFEMRAGKIFAFPASLAEASREDAVAFQRAAQMAAAGEAAAAYDPQRFRAEIPPPNDGLLWLNPPHALLLVAPLARLDYPGVKAAFILLSAVSLFAGARLASRNSLFAVAILLSPAAFASLLCLQTGPMVALGLLVALTMAEKRPIAAGIVLALLTVKPQYGLMAPVFLAAAGNWRAIGAASVATAGLVLLSAIIYGVGPWIAFFEAAAGPIASHAEILHRDMVSVHQFAGKLGADMSLRNAVQIAAILAGAALVLVVTRRRARGEGRAAAIGVTLIASAAVSPSLWVYDWPLFALGLFTLARAASPWPAHLQIAAALLWIAPLISLGFGTMASSLAAPVIMIVALALFSRLSGSNPPSSRNA